MYNATVNEKNFTVNKINFWLPLVFAFGTSLIMSEIFYQMPNLYGRFCFVYNPVTDALASLMFAMGWYQTVTSYALRNYINDLLDNDTDNAGM